MSLYLHCFKTHLTHCKALPVLSVHKTFRQPSPVVDYVWYPTATPMDPASFCFMASVRECPVKLLDASDGRVNIFHPTLSTVIDDYKQLRASYRIVDHRERQIAPNSMAFNMTGQRCIAFSLFRQPSHKLTDLLFSDYTAGSRMRSRSLMWVFQEKVLVYIQPHRRRARKV